MGIVPFQHGRPRRIVFNQPGVCIELGMGGENCQLLLFLVVWNQSWDQTAELIKGSRSMSLNPTCNPRLARTVDEMPTRLPSRSENRLPTLEERQLNIRYFSIGLPLGSGSFGTVYRCINADIGEAMAVKILKSHRPISDDSIVHMRNSLKREVDALSRIKHVSEIVSTASEQLLTQTLAPHNRLH